MKEILMEYLPKIMEYVLIIIVGVLANKAKKLVNTDIKRAVVKDTVRYVEQVFRDIHGVEKLDAAKDKAVKLLEAKGIKVSDEEMIVLIESAVAELNKNDSAARRFVKALEDGTIDSFNVQDQDGDS